MGLRARAFELTAIRPLPSFAKAREQPPIGFSIGLHVGDVLYGNIGVPDRLEFTVIGAAAKEAARLEGLRKKLKQSILISPAFPLLPLWR